MVDDPPDSRTDTGLTEDLLLLLFQPGSGTIAGEGTLFYVLGGAVLVELAQTGRISIEQAGLRGTRVRTATDTPPDDELLDRAWTYIAERPREVQGVLAAIGPHLRTPVLERLVARGDIRREPRKLLGLFSTTALVDGGTGRREALIARVRSVLVDGATADARTASLIALVSASGSLPTFDPEIPWNGAVIARAKALQDGEWGAEAAAAAVTRTMTAIVVNAMVVAAVVLPRN